MALLSSVGFIACQKEATTPLSSAEGTLNVTPRVKAFVEQSSNTELRKSGITISPDSAEWYLEAALNFTAAQAWVPSQDLRRDTISLIMPFEDESINISALYSAFQEASASVPAAWDEEFEHLIAVDVQMRSTDSEYHVDVICLIGTSGEPKNPNTNFGPNAYFRAMWEVAYPNNCGCGSNNGGSGPCAAKQIQNRLNSALPALQVGEYWTNPVTVLVIGSPYLWYCPSNCFDVCLGPSQLSALVQSGWNGFNVNQPANRTKIKAEVYSNYALCCTWAKHEAYFYYGVKQSGAGS